MTNDGVAPHGATNQSRPRAGPPRGLLRRLQRTGRLVIVSRCGILSGSVFPVLLPLRSHFVGESFAIDIVTGVIAFDPRITQNQRAEEQGTEATFSGSTD